MVSVLAYKHPPVQLLSIDVHADQMERRRGGALGSSSRAENAYLLTNCVVKDHSLEAYTFSTNQEIPHILWNLKFVTGITSPCFETKLYISLPPIQIL